VLIDLHADIDEKERRASHTNGGQGTMRKQLQYTSMLTRSLPNIHQLFARLNGLYDGCRPVTTQQLAEAFGVEPYALIPVLHRAESRRMICSYQCRGWIPVS
jgi:hypothetical protein